MKKYLTIFILILIVFCLPLISTKADSGWDSSYDFGGSFDSGGWDFSDGWDSSGSFDFGDSSSISFIYFIATIIIIVTCTLYYLENKKSIFKNNNIYQDINPDLIKEIDPSLDINILKQKVFKIYKDIQTSWMNFDNKKLKTLTTDELYNMYSSQLETLKLKSQKNIMNDITLEDVKITNMFIKENVITTIAYLKVTTYDYVINEKTNKVIRGTKNNKLCIEYIVTLVKNKNLNDTCPNCGALINQDNLKYCEYCRSKLVTNKNDYVLSKKTCIGQKKI